MTSDERIRCFELAIGGSNHPADNVRNAALIRGARPEEREAVVRLIANKRREWQVWLTLSQRKWQSQYSRHRRARSVRALIPLCGSRPENAANRLEERIITREGYVRCG